MRLLSIKVYVEEGICQFVFQAFGIGLFSSSVFPFLFSILIIVIDIEKTNDSLLIASLWNQKFPQRTCDGPVGGGAVGVCT